MSEMRVSDPSKLHLKRELTQIGKATRALRDPGTTSSWKSPLTSSRSVAPASGRWNLVAGAGKLVNGNGKRLDSSQAGVFLCNWKAQEPRNVAAADIKETGGGGGGEFSTSATEGSLDGSFCNSSTSGLSNSRRRDANLDVLSKHGIKRPSVIRRRSKKFNPRLSILLNYPGQKKETFLGRKIRGSVNSNALPNGKGNVVYSRHNPSMALSIDFSAEQSDETGDLSNSEGVSKFRENKWSLSSKLLSTSRKEDSSYTYSTPAMSTSSFYRYRNRNPSTLGSWDGDGDLDDPFDMVKGQGCGIPCYWSKRTPKHRGNYSSSCDSPSLSDTFRRKGSSILCGSQSMYSRQYQSVSALKKQKLSRKSSRGVLPLLSDSRDDSDDELCTDFRELDLEALSRLDGMRWSKGKSRDGSEIPASNGEGEEESTPESSGSLSKKHKPMSFDELIGQNIVVQSLVNAISQGKIAPVYLFQGPRGTGKTSTARIFSAALHCLTTDETSTRPCGYCKECTDFVSGKSKDLWEIDGANKKGIDKVRFLLKKLSNHPPLSSALSRYKVFIIDECHLLPSKIWLEVLKFVEEPPSEVVFIFITTDVDSVPRTVQSRCQKYLFNKIKDTDIASRLRKIITDENLDAELDALDLIALSADGSLRDAETMLEQLSLLGKRITTSLVNELIGVVSDEKLLDLLGLAMSSDTAETVKRARELMDTGVDPLLLMSQLASLIMDIISGTYKAFGGQTLSNAELEKLKNALKHLSDAEKQLRVSSDRPTWFTATLLQLGRVASPEVSQSSISRRHSRTTEEASLALETKRDPSHESNCSSEIDDFVSKMKALNEEHFSSSASEASADTSRNSRFNLLNFEKLNDIWEQCIERCHSKTLRQLLHANTKLVSITEDEGILVAYIAFEDNDIKTRAESFISSITNSTESFLRRNVEVRMLLLPDGVILPSLNKCETNQRDKKDSREEYRKKVVEQIDATNEEIHVQRIESFPGPLNRMKPEKNQVLPQDGTDDQNKMVDELNHELKNLNFTDGRFLQKDHSRKNNCTVSPSLLHDKSFTESLNKENLVYESASGNERGCGSMFCWKSSRPHRREKNKKTDVRSRRNGKLWFFDRCLRPKTESRLRRQTTE